MQFEDVHIGDRVKYHPIIGGENDGRVYTIRAIDPLPTSDGVEYFAWLEEKAGCVSLDALSAA